MRLNIRIKFQINPSKVIGTMRINETTQQGGLYCFECILHAFTLYTVLHMSLQRFFFITQHG